MILSHYFEDTDVKSIRKSIYLLAITSFIVAAFRVNFPPKSWQYIIGSESNNLILHDTILNIIGFLQILMTAMIVAHCVIILKRDSDEKFSDNASGLSRDDILYLKDIAKDLKNIASMGDEIPALVGNCEGKLTEIKNYLDKAQISIHYPFAIPEDFLSNLKKLSDGNHLYLHTEPVQKALNSAKEKGPTSQDHENLIKAYENSIKYIEDYSSLVRAIENINTSIKNIPVEHVVSAESISAKISNSDNAIVEMSAKFQEAGKVIGEVMNKLPNSKILRLLKIHSPKLEVGAKYADSFVTRFVGIALPFSIALLSIIVCFWANELPRYMLIHEINQIGVNDPFYNIKSIDGFSLNR